MSGEPLGSTRCRWRSRCVGAVAAVSLGTAVARGGTTTAAAGWRPATLAVTRLRAQHLQRLGSAAERGMVRHSQGQPEQAKDEADQALGLAQRQAQRQAEHRAQGERRQDGEW